MDILDDVLNTLDLRGTLYFRTSFSAPWAVTVPAHNQVARFHLVIQGRCFVDIESKGYVELNPGDLILIPNGASHTIADSPVDQAPELETLLEDVGYKGEDVLVVGAGDSNAATQLVCGHFNFREKSEHPILKSLPSHILATAGSRAQHPLLDETLRLITRRIFDDNLGSRAAVIRLSEIVFIELLRSGLTQDIEFKRVLEAFHDPKVGQSLYLIHTQPSKPWTVASLASEVAMSRSRFADRFKDLMGMGPMSYLSDWRLQRALALLCDTRQSVQQVALETGFQSPSAFTRAFQGKFGLAPKEYRENTAQA